MVNLLTPDNMISMSYCAHKGDFCEIAMVFVFVFQYNYIYFN